VTVSFLILQNLKNNGLIFYFIIQKGGIIAAWNCLNLAGDGYLGG
jgi:hypothetical protein